MFVKMNFSILLMIFMYVHDVMMMEDAIISDDITYQPMDVYLGDITMTLDSYKDVMTTTESYGHLKTDATVKSQQSTGRKSLVNNSDAFAKDVETSTYSPVNVIDSPLNQDATESIDSNDIDIYEETQENLNWAFGNKRDSRSNNMENKKEDTDNLDMIDSMNIAQLNLQSPYDLMLAEDRFKHNRAQHEFIVEPMEPLLLGIHCNTLFRYGKSQSIVLSLNKLISITAFVNLSTSGQDYLIDAFMWTSNNESYWHPTKFLGKELRLHGISEHKELPFQSGYYRVVTATFWDIGQRDIHLYVSNIFNRQQIYGSAVHHINVMPEHRLMCYPKIKLPKCSDPRNVFIVDVTKIIQFDVELEEDCGMDSYEKLNWNLFGLSETDFIKHMGTSKGLKFRASKYAFVQKSGYAHLVLRVDTVIRSIIAVARCYIFVPPPFVFASILGGSKRLLNNEKINILDGSESMDEAIPGKRPPYWNMHWHCKSTDDHKFCNNLEKLGETVRIPKKSLKVYQTYQFFLRVYSSMYHYIYMETSQIITVTPETTYTPHISCHRNCDWNQYNPNENVYLEAQCIDCPKDVIPLFEWYYKNELYDYKSHSGNPRYFVKQLDEESTIKLQMKVVRRSATSTRTDKTKPIYTSLILKRTGGPRVGTCNVDPRTGVEAYTLFTIQCVNNTGGSPPVWLTIESAHDFRVPVARIERTHKFDLYLPKTINIFITSCDSRNQCDQREIPVDVKQANVTSSLESFQNFLNDQKLKTNLGHALSRNLWQRGFIIAYAAAKHTNKHELLECLHKPMAFYQTENLFDLKQYMFLTVELVANVRPFYHKSAALISEHLRVISRNMAMILEHNEIVPRQDFNKLTRGLLYILLTFSSQRQNLTVSMCQTNDIMCIVGEKYSLNNVLLDSFDQYVALKLNNFLKATVELNQNFYMLTKLASFSINPDQKAIKYEQENAYLKLIGISTETDAQTLISQDGHTNISISKELKKELKEKLAMDRFVVLILTQPDDDGLYWWNSEPVPIISTITTIYAANENSNSVADLRIENPLIFDVEAPMSHSLTADWFINGTLITQYQMQIFTTILRPQAVLVISVVNNTGDIIVLATQNKPPSGHKVHDNGCIVKANATNFRLRLTTYCNITQTVFIAVIPYIKKEQIRSYVQRIIIAEEVLKRPIYYSFMLERYQCTDWENTNDSPGWMPNICQTEVNLTSDHVRCTCYGLGPFSPRIYREFARHYHDSSLKPVVLINWFLVLIYMLLLVVLMTVMLKYIGAVNASVRGSSVSCYEKEEEEEEHNRIKRQRLLVVIRTGGQSNAGTSANVGLFFQSMFNKTPEVGFIINQDPERPKLRANTEIIIRIKSIDITIPTYLRIEIDKQGRYPSWYCRRIILYNLTTFEFQIFLIQNWVYDRTTWYSSRSYGFINSGKNPYTCWKRFKNSIEENFNNWFFFQPLTGPWRSSDYTNSMNRFERSCLWICKLAATICIVAVYYGSSRNQYDSNEDLTSNAEVDITILLKLSFFCFVVCLGLDLLFRVVIMRWILKRF